MHHNGGTLVEPNDIDVKERHLDMLAGPHHLSDKCFMGSVTHADNARDTVTMSQILFGAEAIAQNPATSRSSMPQPLRFDDRMFRRAGDTARAPANRAGHAFSSPERCRPAPWPATWPNKTPKLSLASAHTPNAQPRHALYLHGSFWPILTCGGALL
ncbi:MAG: trimethylamine methyltransferase family protein [Anaerolineae bacterium]